MKRFGFFGAVLGVCGLLAATAWAEPTMTTTYPRGGGQGEVVEMEITGNDLEGATGVLLYEQGLKDMGMAEVTAKYTRGHDQRDVNWDAEKRQVARIEIAKDCAPGPKHFRVVTPRGLSNLMMFWVGTYPSHVERENYREPNDLPENADEIELGTTVNGRLYRGETDSFRFEGKAGQMVTIEVEAMRLGNYARGLLTDVGVRLFDADGMELAAVDDSALYLADPVLSHELPADGNYVVSIASTVPAYDGTPRMYRMHVGAFDRPTVVMPMGAAKAPELNGAPIQRPFRVSDAVNTIEVEPNNTRDECKAALGWPVAVNGAIDAPGDEDFFTFEIPAGKGTRKMEAILYGQALGTRIDGLLDVYELQFDKKDKEKAKDRQAKKDERRDAKGKGDRKNRKDVAGRPEPVRPPKWKRVGGASDVRPNNRGWVRMDSRTRELLDPTAVFTVPKEGGTYALHVRDQNGAGSPEHAYRVEVTAVTLRTLVALPPYGNDSSIQVRNRINVPAGGRTPSWLVPVSLPGNDYKGAYRLEAVGLPDGVTMNAPEAKGLQKVMVVFEAKAGVKPGAHLVDLRAVPLEKEGEGIVSGFQQVCNYHSRQNGNCMIHTKVDRLALCVTKSAPFRLEVAQPDAPLLQDGEQEVVLRLVREKGFDGPVEVTLEMPPPNVNKSTPVKFKKGETEKPFLLSATRRTTPGTYPVVFSAIHNDGSNRNARYGAGDMVTSSRFIDLVVAKPFLSARISKAAIEQGKESTVTVKIEHLEKMSGKGRVWLKGLPRGIELIEESQAFDGKTTEVVFGIRALPDALFGLNRGLHCIFELEENGETVRQKAGYGYLRIDPVRKRKADK